MYYCPCQLIQAIHFKKQFLRISWFCYQKFLPVESAFTTICTGSTRLKKCRSQMLEEAKCVLSSICWGLIIQQQYNFTRIYRNLVFYGFHEIPSFCTHSSFLFVIVHKFFFLLHFFIIVLNDMHLVIRTNDVRSSKDKWCLRKRHVADVLHLRTALFL